MRLRRGLRLSLRALLARRLRALLALASVAVGVAAVLATSALGEGARAEVDRSIEAMGTDLVVIRPAQAKRLVARKAVQGLLTSLRIDDFEEVASLALIREAAPGLDGSMRVKAGAGSMSARVMGTGAAFVRLRNLRLRSGRFFEPEEDASARRVAVLGARVAQTLFEGEDPTGRALRIRGVPFDVIGVLEARGALADGSDEDGNVFIPIRTALRRVFNSTWLTSIFLGLRDPTRRDELESTTRTLLRRRHRLAQGKPDDFAIQSQASLLAMQKKAADSLALLTGSLGAVSLLVGGAGILALMFLSVKERTDEIGLRMAVGARPRDILFQFLAEASLLSLAGWTAGIALGGLATAVLALGTSWKVALPTRAALETLAMATVTGLGFGALPARRAALLPPIRALASR